MTSIPVLVVRQTEPPTLERVLSGIEVQRGILTTEHTASSYGLPVLVVDGQQMGPADLPMGTSLQVAGDFNCYPGPVGYNDWVEREAQINALMQAAIAAGYQVTGYHAQPR